MTTIRAVTLTQPWASLVAMRLKRIETRSWPTSYRGPLAIHAAKGFNGLEATGYAASIAGLRDICNQEPFKFALINHYGPSFQADDLPRGVIVAVTSLERCVEMSQWWIDQQTVLERGFGYYEPGRYAWLLGPVEWLPEPILARGGLGLWDWERP